MKNATIAERETLLSVVLLTIFFVYLIIALIIYIVKVNNDNRTKLTTFFLKLSTSICYLFLLFFRTYTTYVINPKMSKKWAFFTWPIANVSPFTFTLILISLFTFKHEKITNVLNSWVAYVSIGLLIAGAIIETSSFAQLFKGNVPSDDYSNVYDGLSHIFGGILGFYLVKTEQVKINWKSFRNVMIFTGCILAIVITTNTIFDTSLFGLNFNGKQNIYNIVISENPFVSATIYILGLTGLIFGTHLVYSFWKKTCWFKNRGIKNGTV